MVEELIGNREALSLLYDAARREMPAGCYVIAGEEGSGKRSIARLGAAAFCCENKKADGAPCLACRNCRNILSGTHVDVRELDPEKDKKFIPVDDVRQFLKATYVAPVEGDWRIFLINASALNTQGQNALLKSIEEVRPRSVFFLMAQDLSVLLPTVRSRSVILRTEALSPLAITQVLKKETGNSEVLARRAGIAAALCGGSLGKARELLRSDRFFDQREEVLAYFRALSARCGFTKLCTIVSPADTKRQDYTDFLTLAKLCLRDLLRKQNDPGATPEVFSPGEEYEDLAAVVQPARACALFDLTEELLSEADNANVFTGLSRFHREAQFLTQAN